MKGRAEVFLLLWCLLPQPATAQAVNEAARDLARRIAASAPGESASLSFRNQSSLAAVDFDEASRALENDLRAAGLRLSGSSPAVLIRVTASESLRDCLLIAEISRGSQRTVEMAAWPRPPAQPRPFAGAATLEKKLVWEQDDPILDFALADKLLFVLEPARLAVYANSGGGWSPLRDFPITLPGPLARDPRGRLTVEAPAFQAYLPGVSCRGTLEPPAIDCRAGDTRWPIASGATFAGMAAFHSARNYFEGALVTPAGARATAPPFFSMSLAGAGPAPLWIVSGTDGRTAPYNAAFAPAGTPIPGWGSDIAGTEARCGPGRQVLATRPGDASEPDALQAWDISGQQPMPASPAIDFPGPVTALWPAGAAAVSAVVRDPQTGRYAAYSVVIGCGS